MASNKDCLNWAHPIVRDWFKSTLGSPTEPQVQGWPAILANKTTLISAPTGSGKTLAAFLSCINRLVIRSIAGKLENKIEVLYVSPIKALSNDIHKNLTQPLAEIMEMARLRNIHMNEIEVAVRTGDTLMRDRQRMLKKPPHILVTTPESLYILLTAEKSRKMLSEVKTVIVDEIHALVNNKRGSHLALSLERLEALTPTPPIRIGLSATQKPIELVAQYLTGNQRPKPVIIHIGHIRKLDLTIEVPESELGPIASNEMWEEIYQKIAVIAEKNRSTLVFVNTRRLSERIAHHLGKMIGEDKVAAHHGSLSRKIRLEVESRLKNGELKVIVATASLELGIDIGTIDLVCQIGSPRAISIALQRVGRAGHWHGGISKGVFFVTTLDDLLECAALIYAVHENELDAIIIPEEPIDILAQQIVATCATGDWEEEALFQLVKKAFPYRNLSWDIFNSVIEMLTEGIAGSRGRYGAYLFRDQVNKMIKGRRGSRLTAITSGGAIADNGLFTVVEEPDGMVVGTLDEDFAVESNRGDIILLGTTSWQIKRVESRSGKVLVENAHGSPPNVPFWRGEAPGRTNELSTFVSRLREALNELLPKTTPALIEFEKQPNSLETLQWLKEVAGLDESGGEQLIEYILQGRLILGGVPTQSTIIAERFFDESGGMQLIIHSLFGMRINKAWALALQKKFCRSFNFELQAAATDNGLNISLSNQHSFPLSDVFKFLNTNTLKEVLIQAILQSPLFTTRWRWVATRALALVRFRGGKKVPPNIQRMLSDDLLAAVFPQAAACQDNLAGKDIELPDHPLIDETMKEILTDALDFEGLNFLINNIQHKKITCLSVDTSVPSVFSNEIINANPYAFLDDAPLEERRARAVEMRRLLPDSVLFEMGQLDPSAIANVQQQAWPDIRNADELHDILQTFIAFPENILLAQQQITEKQITEQKIAQQPILDFNWRQWFDELQTGGRAGIATVNDKRFWVAVEKKKTFITIYPNAIFNSQLVDIEKKDLARELAILNMIRGWVFHLGPTTTQALCNLFGLEKSEVEYALLSLETQGVILRGSFRREVNEEEWCERNLLARIHRYTLGILRKQVEPVTSSQFVRWLLKWQHVAPGTQLSSKMGLLEVIKQLQGYELPANAWERHIFSKRVKSYDKNLLDQLCLTGVVGWGRISPHPSITSISKDEKKEFVKRIVPTSIARITFFIRGELEWASENEKGTVINENNMEFLSPIAKKIYMLLKQKGALFFHDIVLGVHHLDSEVELGLWELVAVGAITADSFDNLRALIDPKRRGNRRQRRMSIRFSTARWSLLDNHNNPEISPGARTEAICWMLLKRYGVVFRDLILKEKNLPFWRELLKSFRKLEAKGEIRGGRFVAGYIGEQFALPYVIDSLRAIKQEDENDEIITLSAADPLNLIGIILPGSKVAGSSKVIIHLKNGKVI
jgi:ATP-dependent Lhr-like helicase